MIRIPARPLVSLRYLREIYPTILAYPPRGYRSPLPILKCSTEARFRISWAPLKAPVLSPDSIILLFVILIYLFLPIYVFIIALGVISYITVSDSCAPEFTVKDLVGQRNRTTGRKASRQRETSAALAAPALGEC